ncbi:MAG: hypothetical protein ABS949_03230 [Solibacillus sp.]
MKNHEIEYLESLLSEIKYDSNLLKVWTSEEKYIMGFMSDDIYKEVNHMMEM